MSSNIVCFQCGNAVTEFPKLNRLPNGSNCPACVERAYDLVQGALPANVNENQFDSEGLENEAYPDLDEPA